MTNYLELFGLVSTGVGVAFGFGRQSAAIATLRKDTDANHRQHRQSAAIATLRKDTDANHRQHRDILTSLNEIEKKLTRMEERIDFLRDR